VATSTPTARSSTRFARRRSSCWRSPRQRGPRW
jgi:hypothetical protein